MQNRIADYLPAQDEKPQGELLDSDPKLRGKPKHGGPWLWQSKAAYDRILALKDITSALAVYVALTRLSSDEAVFQDQLEASQTKIANLAGVCLRTAIDRLADLREIGLIKISPPRAKGGQCTYRLLKV